MSQARSEYEDLKKIAPDVYDAVFALGQLAGRGRLDKQMLVLIKLRASQINGFAFCLQLVVLPTEGSPRVFSPQRQSCRALARGSELRTPGPRGAGRVRGADLPG